MAEKSDLNESAEIALSNSEIEAENHQKKDPASAEVTPKPVINGNQDDVTMKEAQQEVQKISLTDDETAVLMLLTAAADDKDPTKSKFDQLLTTIGDDSGKIDLRNIANKVNSVPGKSLVASASANGNLALVKLLVENGFNVDAYREDKMTGVMHATLNDNTQIALYLMEKGAFLNTLNAKGETVMHMAVKNKNTQLVEKFILAGANPNYQNPKGNTPLHIACQQNASIIATKLLYLGANMDYTNQSGESPLHEACRNQMHQVIQIMCLQGCNVDFENKGGVTALHIAAKSGNLEIVRLLLLAGADIDRFNKDGLRAEDIALAQGNITIADILSKLSSSITKDSILPLVRQLMPTKTMIKRLKLKVFGGGGVGKTSLIESLKTGYFWNFFRRPYGSTAAPMVPPEGTRNTVLIPFDCYTKGIDIQNVNISGIGELSIWEFSGYESYYSLYDYFVGDPSCIHTVVFRANDDILVRRAQIFFWLNFIRARVAPSEPIGHAGAQLWAPHVILIATNADEDSCSKDSRGHWHMAGWEELEKEIRREFDLDLIIIPEVFVLDAHEANSVEMTELKTIIEKMKTILTKYIGPELGFLEAALVELPAWKRMISEFPVVSWSNFMEYIRTKVNMLATEEHIKQLVAQLQVIGEVIYIPLLDKQDLVILDPKWLTTDLLGKLYSFEQLSVSSPDGRISLEEIHRLQPKAELNDLRKIFNGLDMSTEVLVTTDLTNPFESVLLFDFPALNSLVTPLPLWLDLYLPANPKKRIWGGIRLGRREQMDYQLLYILPRVLVAVRRSLATRQESVTGIREWSTGMQFKVAEVACLVSLTNDRLNLDVVMCTVKSSREKAFELCSYFSMSIQTALELACPGLCLPRMPLSPHDLNSGDFTKEPRSYPIKYLLTAQLKSEDEVELEDNVVESFRNIFAFGSKRIAKDIKLGTDLHVNTLSLFTRSRLAGILDPPHPEGKNFKLLAQYLNIDESKLDLGTLIGSPQDSQQNTDPPEKQAQPSASATDAIIGLWSYNQEATVKILADTFLMMGREDAYDLLISNTLTHIYIPTQPTTDEDVESDITDDLESDVDDVKAELGDEVKVGNDDKSENDVSASDQVAAKPDAKADSGHPDFIQPNESLA